MLKTLPFHFDCFDVVASLAAISLLLRIRADARDGPDQFHRLAAAEARDWMPGFVFGLFSGSHAAKIRLKSIAFQYGCVSHHQMRIATLQGMTKRPRSPERKT